jgi:glutamine synthetase
MAAEQEFCLSQPADVHERILSNLMRAAARSGIVIDSFAREEGCSDRWQQYELRLPHQSPEEVVRSLEFIRHMLPIISAADGAECTFISNVASCNIISSLQIHLHVLNEDDDYLFFKQEERLSEALSGVIGGLLHTMEEAMPAFAPDENARARLQSGADHVPVAVCWGGNNRTAALRLPESVIPHRHIEHRVPASHADPAEVVAAILRGVEYGLLHEPDPGEQLFGDARRSEGLKPLLAG